MSSWYAKTFRTSSCDSRVGEPVPQEFSTHLKANILVCHVTSLNLTRFYPQLVRFVARILVKTIYSSVEVARGKAIGLAAEANPGRPTPNYR